MQAVIRLLRPLSPFAIAAILAGCGGGAAPASSAPPASSPAPASSAAAASKPASTAAPASAKPAASTAASASAKPAASTAASAKPAASTAASGSAAAKPAASGSAAGKPAASGGAVTLPSIPATVPVSVDAKTSAFLILDLNQQVCQPNPVCTATVPAVEAFMKKARDAKMPVVYSSTGAAPGSPILPALAPQQGEQTVAAHADKFIGTDLDGILKKLGAKTLVIVGSASNGAVLYTSFHANALGYTVAVATDGISAAAPFATFEAEYQLLNQPGAANADNKPLQATAVTLTKTDQITIK